MRPEHERHALDLGRGLVEIDSLLGQLGRIHMHEAGAAHTRVDFRQTQQRVEDPYHAIDVRHRRVDLGKGLLRIGTRQGELLEP